MRSTLQKLKKGNKKNTIFDWSVFILVILTTISGITFLIYTFFFMPSANNSTNDNLQKTNRDSFFDDKSYYLALCAFVSSGLTFLFKFHQTERLHQERMKALEQGKPLP